MLDINRPRAIRRDGALVGRGIPVPVRLVEEADFCAAAEAPAAVLELTFGLEACA